MRKNKAIFLSIIYLQNIQPRAQAREARAREAERTPSQPRGVRGADQLPGRALPRHGAPGPQHQTGITTNIYLYFDHGSS